MLRDESEWRGGLKDGAGGLYRMSEQRQVTDSDVTAEWLRATGWTYHAIGKYFYLRTAHDTLLIRETARDWQVSALSNDADPREYVDLEAVLFTDATRESVMTQVRLCNSGVSDSD